ncbi:5659_t:CDS:2 [Acaulospora colombiana]|uniref:5659_t:CDS:1 n=1 Tax=Acaulospora colombiana TaxID=27376 RepID=A0ACA9LNM2_9GLOM|nr:5659_t:CDS:2 [Acaulospora colombiana]
MVESRIRHLISKLENVENLSLAHPFVKGFDRVQHCATEKEAEDVQHGIFDYNKSQNDKSGSESSQNFAETNIFRTVYVTTFYIGLSIDPREEFIKLVKSWDKFDEKSMGIAIRYVKRGDLPQEVFEGEQRQTKLKRSKPSSKTEQNNNKTLEQPSKKHKKTDNTDSTSEQLTANRSDTNVSKLESNKGSKLCPPAPHDTSSPLLHTRPDIGVQTTGK